jgi:drug/metabolite transporter (DMT)-like permease
MQGVSTNPISKGSAFAILAALSFGVTAPLVQRFGRGAGPVPTAVLLYFGAALATVGPRRAFGEEAPVRRAHAPRLFWVAVLGAVMAPIALAWGLQHASATSASLLLNFEAVFTVLLGRLFFGEHMGTRVTLAVTLMVLAGTCLVLAGRTDVGGVGWGAIAIVLATLCWAMDNALTKPLADLDPTEVVRWKAALGAALGLGLSLALRQHFPDGISAIALLACGATGYGASLRLYLLAQRRIGAARTGSIFAVAPFAGAVAAWAMGDHAAPVPTLAAAVLFGVGIYLHLTEKHAHLHTHDPVEHEHAHRHDDGHHDHLHDPPFEGEHSHPHRHDERTHAHAHAPDAHHIHRH